MTQLRVVRDQARVEAWFLLRLSDAKRLLSNDISTYLMESIHATSTTKHLIKLAIPLICKARLRNKDAASGERIATDWQLIRLVLNRVRLALKNMQLLAGLAMAVFELR